LACCQKEVQCMARCNANGCGHMRAVDGTQERREKCRANCAETVPREGNWCSFSITGILQSLAI
jgi:hypothetical protein